MTSGLMARAGILLRRAEREDVNLAEVAKAAGVSKAWVSLLRLGKMPNPGVNTIEAFIRELERALANPK